MDSGDYPWTSRLSTSSRRYHSRSEIYVGGDDVVVEVEDDYKQEFLCPFCAEEFDMVGLCCHVDEEHPIELKHGVCPICAKRVEMDMVSHITMQHGNILMVQRRRRRHRGGSTSVISMLRKELRDTNKHPLFGGYSHALSSSNPDPDPFLSSLVFSSPVAKEPVGLETDTYALTKLDNLRADRSITKSRVEQSRLSEKDQEETARKCEFVQEILLSKIFDDDI